MNYLLQRRRRFGSFSPAAIFANGDAGVWLDPSDTSTMFTDTAGTTQATVGDPVARINDKSGNGNHATQAVLASRPILRQSGGLHYLEFDGVDDAINATIPVPLTARWTLVSGQQRGAEVNAYVSMRLTSNSGANDFIGDFTQGSERIQFQTRGLSSGYALTSTLTTVGSYPSGVPSVFTGIVRPIPENIEHRLNGSPSGTSFIASNWPAETALGTSCLLSQNPPSAGERLYSRVIVNKELNGDELVKVETYVAQKTGVVIA